MTFDDNKQHSIFRHWWRRLWAGQSPSHTVDPNDEHREFRLMESVVADAFSEQKRSRRWGIVFKLLTFTYLFVALALFLPALKGGQPGSGNASKPHTAIIRIDGPIAADKPASAGKINNSLRAAFDNEKAKAIILLINSPGGSPVQSAYVYDEIRRLKALNPDKKVYAVIQEMGASGAYYIAAAADFIYANRSSLVGSIGVTASGFGFVDTMEKLGVERRHYTAGEHKAFLDPFSPVKESENAFWQAVLTNTHQQFIAAVKQGRGDRLQMTDDITSGLIWNGEQALALGLIDGLGSARFVAREKIEQEELVDYSYQESPVKQLLQRFGLAAGTGLVQALQSSYPRMNY